MEHDTKKWFSARAAATYCDFSSPRQIYAAIREGALIAFNRGGRGGFRIHKHDLDAWLRGNKQEQEDG